MLLPAVVVLADNLNADAARTLLLPYSDHARTVVSRRTSVRTLWYLFTARDVRIRMQDAAATDTLRTILDLDHVTPVETRQVSARMPTTEMTTDIVLLDGEQVAGVVGPNQAAVAHAQDRWVESEPSELRGVDDLGFRSRKEHSDGHLFEIVRVFYGTDRKPEGQRSLADSYGGVRGELTFGTADVSIPARRTKGTMPRPAWWRLEFREDPARHVMISQLSPLSRDRFVDGLRETLQRTKRKHAFLFVHGYNVTFADGLRRTAQLAYDLRTDEIMEFPGVPIHYSWPSQGQFLKYISDETNVAWSVPDFEQFLRLVLAETGAEVVHLIAHSMGTRALIECLRVFDASTLPAGSAVLDEIILAAPDFDADSLRKLAGTLSSRARRYTLYASSGDQALKASRELRGDLARAGESGEHMVVVKGIDTVDASQVDTSLLGHSYFGERTVLGDIFYLLKDGQRPSQRYGLQQRGSPDLPYWEFVP